MPWASSHCIFFFGRMRGVLFVRLVGWLVDSFFYQFFFRFYRRQAKVCVRVSTIHKHREKVVFEKIECACKKILLFSHIHNNHRIHSKSSGIISVSIYIFLYSISSQCLRVSKKKHTYIHRQTQ